MHNRSGRNDKLSMPNAESQTSTEPPTALAPAEAATAILGEVARLGSERVPLVSSLGRVLSHDVKSPIDIPQWDNSAMDGYAVRRADITITGDKKVVLKVVDSIPAGAFPSGPIHAGECMQIFTGAPVPNGADTVVRQEDTTRIDEQRVRINDPRDAGRNIRKRGEDIQKSALVLERGTEIGPAQIGVLASIAAAEAPVTRIPFVAILSTGDEIADLDERKAILNGTKIASSNSYTMAAMAIVAGAEPLSLGIAKDNPDEIRALLTSAGTVDLLVTSGGMSVGEHDHLRQILRDEATQMKFWRLRTRPGAPVGFGILNGRPWIGLPGNPVSTMVTFELFVRPAIRKLRGHLKPFRRTRLVRLTQTIKLNAPLTHFLRVVVSEEKDGLSARLTGPQGSGILSSMAKADALMIVPEDRQVVKAGETLQAILLNETEHVAEVPY
jgi:molybdopterin molybdotransferase